MPFSFTLDIHSTTRKFRTHLRIQTGEMAKKRIMMQSSDYVCANIHNFNISEIDCKDELLGI